MDGRRIRRIPADWRNDYYGVNPNPTKHTRQPKPKKKILETKYCPRCEKTLERTMFGVNSKRFDQLQAYCRSCHRIMQRRYIAEVRKNRKSEELNQ